jgi:hypothetical protein
MAYCATAEQHFRSWVLPSLPESCVGTPEWYAVSGGATHMQTYPAATAFASWLERRQNELGLNQPGVAILELGAGQGWLGHVLASNLNSADVMLTDRHEAIKALQSHAAGACGDLLQSRTSMRVTALDWYAFLPSQTGSSCESFTSLPNPLVGDAFDVIVGTDLFCTGRNSQALAWVMRALLEKGMDQGVQRTSAFYGHWCRSPRLLSLFMENCAAAGLICEDCTKEPQALATPSPAASSEDLIHCASAEIATPDQEAMPTPDSDGDIDWTHELFKDSKMLSDEPMFKVYRFSLGN